jgi:hypothetical protein
VKAQIPLYLQLVSDYIGVWVNVSAFDAAWPVFNNGYITPVSCQDWGHKRLSFGEIEFFQKNPLYLTRMLTVFEELLLFNPYSTPKPLDFFHQALFK